jgi:hypothetical protein
MGEKARLASVRAAAEATALRGPTATRPRAALGNAAQAGGHPHPTGLAARWRDQPFRLHPGEAPADGNPPRGLVLLLLCVCGPIGEQQGWPGLSPRSPGGPQTGASEDLLPGHPSRRAGETNRFAPPGGDPFLAAMRRDEPRWRVAGDVPFSQRFTCVNVEDSQRLGSAALAPVQPPCARPVAPATGRRALGGGCAGGSRSPRLGPVCPVPGGAWMDQTAPQGLILRRFPRHPTRWLVARRRTLPADEPREVHATLNSLFLAI